jgi:hypothetical protein
MFHWPRILIRETSAGALIGEAFVLSISTKMWRSRRLPDGAAA